MSAKKEVVVIRLNFCPTCKERLFDNVRHNCVTPEEIAALKEHLKRHPMNRNGSVQGSRGVWCLSDEEEREYRRGLATATDDEDVGV